MGADFNTHLGVTMTTMLRRRAALALLTFLLLVNARQRSVGHPSGWPLTAPPVDVYTFSNPSEVTTEHLILDLAVDFEARTLHGIATLDIRNLTGTDKLVLDTYLLDVSRVTLDGGTPATWSFGTSSAYGRPLNITIAPNTDTVTIEYTTSPDAFGLNWNTAEQSYGRVEPYLYSLNEPVGARSWIPIQDTPAMRTTYEATLRVPRGLMALMSAEDNATAVSDTGLYVVHMGHKIPPYLIALAVGRLQFHPFDERTGVYAEPELMDDAAWELQYLPEMLDAAERIAGTFPFRRHDVLLMPPTFTAGGMEHPMLNFILPFNLITGNHPDPPQPSALIAHELAHSWAGDATTLATWDDVWLNEGITSYLTLRILEEMPGPVPGPEYAEMRWFFDRSDYTAYAATATAAQTTLHRTVPSAGAGFSGTSYTKGELFLKTIEDTLGRPAFDFFLRRYFQLFAFRWVDDKNFLAALREFGIRGNAELEASLRLDEWLYQGGLPSNVTAPTSSTLEERVLLRSGRFRSGTPLAQLDPQSWTDVEKELFLQASDTFFIVVRIAEVDAALGFSAQVTPPLNWLNRAIEAHYQPAMPAVERALLRGGPSGWITSLYGSLVRNGQTQFARDIFAVARDRYTDAVEAQIASLLNFPLAATVKTAA
jgi:aminopeptidase N